MWGFWPRPGRIRHRTKRVVVEYTGDVSVSTGTYAATRVDEYCSPDVVTD